MRNSTIVTAITLMTGFALGFMTNRWRVGGADVISTEKTVGSIAPATSDDETASGAPVRTEGEKSSVNAKASDDSNWLADLGCAEGSETTITEDKPSAATPEFNEHRAKMREAHIQNLRFGLTNFFELYGIDEQRAEFIVTELVDKRRQIEQEVRLKRQSFTYDSGTMKAIREAMNDLEKELFDEYADAYKDYKTKQHMHAQVTRLSSRMDQPMELATRQQVADIILEVQARERARRAFSQSSQGPSLAISDAESMQQELVRMTERFDDILGQTGTVLSSSQQQTLSDYYARRREVFELQIRMLEIQAEDEQQ